MKMPEKTPGFWIAVLAWLQGYQTDLGYAILAALFSFLRNAWAKYPWSRRLLDAMSCSALAFFAKPLLMLVEHVLGWSLPAEAPQALAIYIGYVGTDYIRERIKAFTRRKNQES
ncbi:phage holin, lambda family [Candidatus Sodalis endolongispinus]|uniref:Phage holin, lambda family n=2 Tax=Candidatus Sodalis endolongispinus TaxID=2812662 RepID=A0ABS5Y8K1_9GAMM|nr:phage holin, lambda family [Candidatus Sodalis endolongispinus]